MSTPRSRTPFSRPPTRRITALCIAALAATAALIGISTTTANPASLHTSTKHPSPPALGATSPSSPSVELSAAHRPPPVIPAPVTVSYGPSPAETATVYASPVPHSPLAIVVHGGGWVGGTNTDYGVPDISLYLQSHHVTVWSINYDLALPTRSAFPLQVNEVAQATKAAMDQAASYNAAPRRVSLIGGSAGGTLVAMAAATLESRHVRVRSVTVLSGPSNFASYIAFAAASPAVSALLGPALPDTLGCPDLATCDPAIIAAASPVNHPAARPHWLIIASSADPLVPIGQATEEVAALQAVGARVDTIYSTDPAHAFQLESPTTNAAIRAAL